MEPERLYPMKWKPWGASRYRTGGHFRFNSRMEPVHVECDGSPLVKRHHPRLGTTWRCSNPSCGMEVGGVDLQRMGRHRLEEQNARQQVSA